MEHRRHKRARSPTSVENTGVSPTMDLKIRTALQRFSIDQNHVSLTLAKHVISSGAKERNLVLSPMSIHALLGLVAAGSSGRTQEEILGYFKSKSSDEFNSSLSQLVAVLFADGSSVGGPRLSSANGVWVDQRFPLKPRFKEIAGNDYKAATDQVDFKNQADEAIKKVNMWVEEKTNGSVNELTRLICGNAVYF